MEPILDKRATEVIVVFLCVAMLIGIATPVYFKLVQKAGAVSAESSLGTAEKTILAFRVNNPSVAVSAGALQKSEPKIHWLDIPQDSRLPPFDELTSRQRQSVCISVDRAGGVCIFVITPDKNVLYSRGKGETFTGGRTVKYEQGIPGVFSVGKGG